MMDQADQLRFAMNAQNPEADSMDTARVITVTSGKGGVGKSNTAVNLAVQLKRAGNRVILFDADFGLANVEVMFNTAPRYTLSDMIFHGKSMKDIVTYGPMDIGFVSGGSSVVGMGGLTKDQVAYVIHSIGKLNELADYIIIDTGAGISDQVLEFVVASPEVILVATPEPSSLTDSYSLVKALYRHPGFSEKRSRLMMLANRVTSRDEARTVYDKLQSVVTQFLHGKLEYIGMIPQDSLLEKAVRQQKIVSITSPHALSSRAFSTLADNLMDGTVREASMRRGITELFIHLLGNV